MATRIAWWLNLDAALELARPRAYVRSAAMEQRMRALAPRLELLVTAEDVVLDGRQHACDLDAFTPLAFCPTPTALSALVELGFTPPTAPALDVLRSVTCRAFAAKLGQTLPGARYVESLAALLELLDTPSSSGEWLLKRDFSFAARERRRIRGGTIDASTLGFVKRSFAAGQGLQVEPYVERLADFAQHGFVLSNGAILEGPALLQHCDARGVWQRSEQLPAATLSEAERHALAQNVHETGRALSAAGFTGPFGLDAFRYRGPDGDAFQPRSEVNARFSMGYPRNLLERALTAIRQTDE